MYQAIVTLKKGEADFLPGIVVDKFSDVLVVESLALGIDRWKPVIVEALKKALAEDGIKVRGVYERSERRAGRGCLAACGGAGAGKREAERAGR